MNSSVVADLDLGGERLKLLPEKAVWWPGTRTLILADTHFGKAATFRHSGIPVPSGTTQSILTRLSRLIHQWQPVRLCILGDFVHASVRLECDFAAELLDWRADHSTLDLVLIRGNHDHGQERLWNELRLGVVDEPWLLGPFAMCHQPSAMVRDSSVAPRGRLSRPESRVALAGHLHPCVRLSSSCGDSLRLPCFHLRGGTLILPAFGDFTGMHTISRGTADQVFVVAEDRVFPVRP